MLQPEDVGPSTVASSVLALGLATLTGVTSPVRHRFDANLNEPAADGGEVARESVETDTAEASNEPTSPEHREVPSSEAPSSEAPSSEAPSSESPLSLPDAVEVAREARVADPNPDTWHAEGVALEAAGRWQAAAAAYRAELKELPVGTARRTAVSSDLQRVVERARGVVPHEPKSQHRAELDQRWTTNNGSVSTKVSDRPVPTKERERIVSKWYFWVTVGAIVASAAAVTAIAIRANQNEDGPDALDGVAGGSRGLSLVRF